MCVNRLNLFSAAILVSLILLSMQSLFTESQISLPREETVFVTGAQWTPASTWNPIAPSQTWGTQVFGGFLYLPLFQYIPGLDSWLPIIASKWEWIDNETIRVYIRPEAKWSDGTPITADDVEYTFRLSRMVGSGPAAGSEAYLRSVEVVNEKTVDFKMNTTTSNYFMFLLYALQFTPVPKHVFEPVYNQIGGDIINWRNCGNVCQQNPAMPQVVSGPYRLYYFDELRIVYERIDDWWGKSIFGLPGPRYIVHRIYLSNEQAILDLMQGNVDWSGIFIPQIWTLFSKGVGTYYSSPPYFRPHQIVVLYINNQVEELKDPVLRKAIAYAINYNELINKAWYGYTEQASVSLVFGIYPEQRKWINTTLAREYWGNDLALVATNQDLARQLLDQAGYRDIDGDGFRETPSGKKLSLTIMVPSGWTDWMLAAELIAASLRNIGLNAQSVPVDYGAYWGNINSGSYTLLIGWTTTMNFAHPWEMYRYTLDPRLTPPTGNWGWYNNSAIISLLENSAKAVTYEEKMKYYTEIQRIIYEEMPVIPLVYAPQWYSYNTKYWVGWPNENNPWWTEVAPYKEYSLPLWTLFSLVKPGSQVSAPTWAKPVNEGGLLIPNVKLFQELANITGISVIETTTTTTSPTTTTTATTASPATTTTPATTTPVQSERGQNALLVIGVAVLALVVIAIVVRLIIKGRGVR